MDLERQSGVLHGSWPQCCGREAGVGGDCGGGDCDVETALKWAVKLMNFN